jgi:hypothetical protein
MHILPENGHTIFAFDIDCLLQETPLHFPLFHPARFFDITVTIIGVYRAYPAKL